MAPSSRPSVLLARQGSGGAAAAFELSAHAWSVGAARRNLRSLLRQCGVASEVRDGVELVASELVTNAVAHTDSGTVVLRFHDTGERLRLEVEDENTGTTRPQPCDAGPDEERGRGLLLVSSLSAAWGVESTASGSGLIVWAELLREPSTADRRPDDQAGAVRGGRAQAEFSQTEPAHTAGRQTIRLAAGTLL